MRPRDNPFRVERLHALRYHFDGESWDTAFERLGHLDFRAAIVGPPGSGKTTLLLELARRLPDHGLRPWLLSAARARGRRDPGRTHLGPLPPASAPTVLLVDGAERLSRFGWWRLVRASRRLRGIVVTRHRRCRSLPTWIAAQPTLALAIELARELCDERECWREDELRRLYQRFDGNLRACFLALFDVAAGRSKNLSNLVDRETMGTSLPR